MKSYQFYKIGKFPEMKPGESRKNEIQMTFSGEGESVETELTMKSRLYEGTLSLVRVKSAVRYETFGYIKTTVDHQRRKLEFTEYLQPVDFPAYHDATRGIIVFQEAKRICRGVLSNLRANPSCGVELIEMTVDFTKVLLMCREFYGAWFRGVSARVRAAGLTGDQLQDDILFKRLIKDGELSNVTIPWILDEVEHRVMLTSIGGVVLVQDYKANQGLELRIVTDVYDKLLSKVWNEKRDRRRSGSDLDVEP